MAFVDVTEVLSDPDFVDPISIIHRTATLNSLGENIVETVTTVNTIGSVQPASGATLLRLPDALRVPNVNSFWVKGEIISDSTSTYPDILVYKGYEYEVQLVLDWTNWAPPGYSMGTCIRRRISL